MRVHEIYEKLSYGVRINDDELLAGIEAYRNAADALFKLGLAFNVTAKEANAVYLNLHDFAVARGIVKL